MELSSMEREQKSDDKRDYPFLVGLAALIVLGVYLKRDCGRNLPRNDKSDSEPIVRVVAFAASLGILFVMGFIYSAKTLTEDVRTALVLGLVTFLLTTLYAIDRADFVNRWSKTYRGVLTRLRDHFVSGVK
jgi:cell division protein FtsW (lipid II flippase)